MTVNNAPNSRSVLSGVLRIFALASALLIATFGATAIQAQSVYVANNNDHTISVIAQATNTVTATISLLTAPFALAASPDGSRVYAGDLDGDPFASATIYVIDPSTNSVVNTFALPIGSASSLAVTPNGSTIYATDHHSGNVVAVNTATGAVTAELFGVADNAIVMLPNGTAAYAGNADTSTVSAISTATNAVTATVPVTGLNQQVQQFAATPDGSFVWVPRANASALSIISTATNSVTATIPISNEPFGVAITPDGKFAYVTQSAFFGGVSVIDTASHAVVATIPAEIENPLFAAVSPDGAFVYVSNFEDRSVWVISTATNSIVATVPVGARPTGIVVVLPHGGGGRVASSITANFNGTAIPAGDSLWFSSVAKVSGLGSAPVTIFVRNASISFTANGTPMTVAVPDANLTFDPSATTATTTFNASANRWQTTVPASGLAGNVFLDGALLSLPNGLPGGIHNVTWTASFAADKPGITMNWKWAAAAYTSLSLCSPSAPDLNCLGVKPVDDNHASQYHNSDHAGTPENSKSNVVGGGTGGGGSNYTGGYSGTKAVAPPVTTP